jgi:hypothetical protein
MADLWRSSMIALLASLALALPDPDDGTLREPQSWAAPQGRQARRPTEMTLGFSVEWWKAELEMTSNNTGAAVSTENADNDYEVVHPVALLVAELNYPLATAMLRGHVGVGFEIPSFTRIDLSPVEDPDADRFEESLVWEVGAEYEHWMGTTVVTLSVLYRNGEADLSDSGVSLSYGYTMLRFCGEIGFMSQDGLRPFVGLRYTTYESEVEASSGAGTLREEFEFEQPLGVSAGVDIFAGRLTARVELMFVDVEMGALTSVTLMF